MKSHVTRRSITRCLRNNSTFNSTLETNDILHFKCSNYIITIRILFVDWNCSNWIYFVHYNRIFNFIAINCNWQTTPREEHLYWRRVNVVSRDNNLFFCAVYIYFRTNIWSIKPLLHSPSIRQWPMIEQCWAAKTRLTIAN